jgi:hypothetical protein
MFQDPMRETSSDPEAKIQYFTELLVEDLRVLMNEHALLYRHHIIETSSWEEFAINTILPNVLSAIDEMVRFEEWKLNEAQRHMELKDRWDASIERVAMVQRDVFRKQYGYEAPGSGPIAPWGYILLKYVISYIHMLHTYAISC